MPGIEIAVLTIFFIYKIYILKDRLYAGFELKLRIWSKGSIHSILDFLKFHS